jgi:hypothetical protein
MGSKVIPPGAGQLAVLHALVRKRAELDGRIEERRAELRALLVEIDHVDGTIRVFNPDIDITGIRPRPARARLAADHGEVTRIVIDALREACEPLTSRELAISVMQARDLNLEDRELILIMAKRVRACLRYHRLKKTVRIVPAFEGSQGWEIAR